MFCRQPPNQPASTERADHFIRPNQNRYLAVPGETGLLQLVVPDAPTLSLVPLHTEQLFCQGAQGKGGIHVGHEGGFGGGNSPAHKPKKGS